MRRRLASVLLALMLVALGAGQALAIGTLDQEAPCPCFSFTALGAGQTIWQTFTAGVSGQLDTVALYGPQELGSGNIWNVTIQAVDGGTTLPSGPALSTGSAAAPAAPDWTDVSLTPAAPVTAGTMYAIVVSGPSPYWGEAAADYPGGYPGANQFSGAGAPLDRAFRTYVTVTTQQPPVTRPAPDPEFSLTKGVATTQAGPFTSSVAAPTGSTVWYQLVLTNRDPNGFVGLTLVDSAAGNTFPAACPAIPSPFAAGSTYTCTYSATVGTGTVTNVATAKFGPTVRTASATVTAMGAAASPTPTVTPTPVPTPVSSSPGGGDVGVTITPPATDAGPRTSGGNPNPPVLPVLGLLAVLSGLVLLAVRRRPTTT
jgi:hypothetical protein